MAGYRCVNYYDLCRLCTTSSSSGSKIHIFSPEGKKKNLHQKIADCLPVIVDEKDKLPKILCGQCLQQVESISEFRNVCLNSQAMLESCLNSTTLQNGGKVYIKDANSSRITSLTTTTTANVVKEETITNVTQGSDFLSTIIQAVGIQSNDDIITETRSQMIPQYTVTLDGKAVKTGQIEYKVEEHTAQSEKQAKHNSLAEFLKMKPNIRVTPISKKKDPPQTVTHIQQQQQQSSLQHHHHQQQQHQQQTQTVQQCTPITITTPEVPKQKKQKYNLVLTSPSSQQHKTATLISAPTTTTTTGQQTKTVSLQDVKFLSSNKCFVPITIKDCNTDQQIVAQIDTKNLVLPTTYHLQMKLQPQIVDGQPIMQLTPTAIPATLSLAPQSMQTQNFQQQHQQQQHHLQQHHQQQQQQHHHQQQDHQTQIITSGIDASTSTDTEIIIATANQIQNQQVPANITIQQVSQPTTNTVQHTTMPKLQITTIPTTISTTSNQVQIHKTHSQPNTITVQRINKQQNVKMKTEGQKATAHKTKVTISQPAPNTTTSSSSSSTSSSTTNTTGSTKAENTAITNECALCGRAFKKKEHLAQHMKLHAGLRPFKCTEVGCNKAFSRKEHLMRHIVSHTGKKMFSCDQCQKLFSRKDNLNKHKRTHTEQSGNNGQFVCEICNKSFVVKMYYIQHKMMHEKNGQTTSTTGSTKTKIERITTDKITEQQNQQQQQQQQQQQHQQTQIMQLQISDVTNSIAINQGTDQQHNQTTTTVLKTLGSHDTAVLNLPSNLANLVSINSAQFMTTSELMGHIKLENK